MTLHTVGNGPDRIGPDDVPAQMGWLLADATDAVRSLACALEHATRLRDLAGAAMARGYGRSEQASIRYRGELLRTALAEASHEGLMTVTDADYIA